MKRMLIFFFVLLDLLLLNGCTLSKSFTPLAHEYLVSALGFDRLDNDIYVTIESVIVNSEDSEAEKKNELIIGSGDSLESAMMMAMGKVTQPMEFSHSAVAVIGKSVNDKYLGEICEYMYNEKDITLSIAVISTENANELLACDTVSSVAVGYDIMSMQQTYSRLSGIDFKNRFYELEAKRRDEVNTFSLPFFNVDNGEYYIEGITAFKNDTPVMRIKGDDASVYAIATDSQGAGRVSIAKERLDVESVTTVCKLKNEKLPQIKLEIKIKANLKKEHKEKLEAEIVELFELSKIHKADIFGIGDILKHKESEFFEKIRKNFDEFYANLELEVVVK